MIRSLARPSLLVTFVAIGLAARASAAVPARHIASGDLPAAAVAHAFQPGEKVRITGVAVPATSETVDFDVERFEVFTPDADVVVHGDLGTERHLGRPTSVYFKGSVAGEPGSRVFLETQPTGETRGVVSRGDDEMYLIDTAQEPPAKAGEPARLQAERADTAMLKANHQPWTCAGDKLPTPPRPLAGLDLTAITGASTALATTSGPTDTKSLVTHTARVAIESDYEFYHLFNSSSAATSYIANLIGYASSAVYEPELSTSLMVSSVSLWSTSSDPWTQTSTECGLAEFGKYWNQNKTGTSRTIAHFLSGKANGGGIAWLGVLCAGTFTTGMASSCPGLGAETTPWGGGYGYSGSINGGFNISNPQMVWDILAVTHEIGHNFDSPHSHCYKGIGGSSSPIDGCYNGESANTACYGGADELPGLNSLAATSSYTGKGTIMSYCHLLGGYGSVAYTFGARSGFSDGVLPGREAAQMNSYVQSFGTAACLAPVSTALFANGFEGGLGAWSTKSL